MGTLGRAVVFDHEDQFACEINPNKLIAFDYVTEVNGEHSVTVCTMQQLSKTNRIVMRDGTNTWYEYVVHELVESHQGSFGIEYEYYCTWSLQYDMSGTYVNDAYGAGVVPGHASVPQSAQVGLGCALGGTTRWQVGTVTVLSMASASFYRRSGWDGLKTVVEHWGGELRATIVVGVGGVVGRYVDLLDHVGNSQATRRFEYGADVSGIRKVLGDEVWPCRIVPVGKSSETDAGGYTRRPGIGSVNDGVEWLQDDEMVPYRRVRGSNGYEYPTVIVENDTYEDPAELKAWAEEHITDYTHPVVTYEADLMQFVSAGLNPHGIAEGDAIGVVDKDYGPEGLRIEARVLKMSGSLLDPSNTKLEIGRKKPRLSGQLSDLSKRIDRVDGALSTTSVATADYLANLIDHINDLVNGSGGYTYLVPGLGQRTYDVAVSDPAVGSEASRCVEIRGGHIRIADSLTAAGDWDWRSVFDAGHIATDMVVAAHLVTGWIQSANGFVQIDLDNGAILLGGASVPDLIDDARRYATDYIHLIQGVGIQIGSLDDSIRNVQTHDSHRFETDAGVIASFGRRTDGSNVWELGIDNADIRDTLRFGDFAWIRRQNGNMTIKWIGA